MKSIYLLNFEIYDSQHYCYLISERIQKLPVIKVRRQFGDLPFWKYFKMRLFYRMAHWLKWQADIIEQEIKMTEGFAKDVIWKQRRDGLFEPYDTLADISFPHLARKLPPQKKRIYKGRVVAVKS